MTNNACNTDKPLQVARGGTGQASLTAYSALTAGATSTAAIVAASSGSSGSLFVSSGGLRSSSFRPIGMKLVSTQNLVGATEGTWTGLSGVYVLVVDNMFISGAPGGIELSVQISDDNGATWKNSDYLSGRISTENTALFSSNDRNSSTTQFLLSGHNAATSFWASGSYDIGQFGVSTNFVVLNGLGWGQTNTLAAYYVLAGGIYQPVSPITPNGIRVFTSAGTMTGAISLYSM